MKRAVVAMLLFASSAFAACDPAVVSATSPTDDVQFFESSDF